MVKQLQIEVSDNAGASRYEGRVDGELAGFCDYRIDGSEMILPHTETLPAYRGRGVADTIVGFALADAEARGLTVVPQCWFVEEYMSRERGEAV